MMLVRLRDNLLWRRKVLIVNVPQTSPGIRRLSVAEAAQSLGVAVPTLRRWLARRLIAFSRCGRRIVIDPNDLEQFLSEHRVEAIR
jgi:excisionase family DNA binding protein